MAAAIEDDQYQKMGKKDHYLMDRQSSQAHVSQNKEVDRNFTNSPIQVPIVLKSLKIEQKNIEEEKEPLQYSRDNQRTHSSMETVDPLEIAKWDFNSRQDYYKMRQDKRKRENALK